MGEGNGTSHALRPPGVYPGRCAANGCPGLKTGVAAAHAGDLPLWNASADLHMHRCTSQAQVFSPSETSLIIKRVPLVWHRNVSVTRREVGCTALIDCWARYRTLTSNGQKRGCRTSPCCVRPRNLTVNKERFCRGHPSVPSAGGAPVCLVQRGREGRSEADGAFPVGCSALDQWRRHHRAAELLCRRRPRPASSSTSRPPDHHASLSKVSLLLFHKSFQKRGIRCFAAAFLRQPASLA